MNQAAMVWQAMTARILAQSAAPYIVAAFFAVATVPVFIFLHVLGNRLFVRSQSSGSAGGLAFFLGMLAPGAAGTVLSCLIPNQELQLVLGLASGVFLWTALGDVTEKLGWISTYSRTALLLFFPVAAGWAVLAFAIRGIPIGLVSALGYPVFVWGLHLTRVRVISHWGPTSIAGIIMALLYAMVAGAALALGIIGQTIISGIIGGVFFAISAWSTLEIIWERGMAEKPWRR
jgi:hypothetical protein